MYSYILTAFILNCLGVGVRTAKLEKSENPGKDLFGIVVVAGFAIWAGIVLWA